MALNVLSYEVMRIKSTIESVIDNSPSGIDINHSLIFFINKADRAEALSHFDVRVGGQDLQGSAPGSASFVINSNRFDVNGPLRIFYFQLRMSARN